MGKRGGGGTGLSFLFPPVKIVNVLYWVGDMSSRGMKVIHVVVCAAGLCRCSLMGVVFARCRSLNVADKRVARVTSQLCHLKSKVQLVYATKGPTTTRQTSVAACTQRRPDPPSVA
ncbi:unnamed protein product [Scytosiphon promiscuus]